MYHNAGVGWDVEVTDEFRTSWDGLTEAERVSVERADQVYDNYLAEMEEEDSGKNDKVQ
jgi:hypothetical protein